MSVHIISRDALVSPPQSRSSDQDSNRPASQVHSVEDVKAVFDRLRSRKSDDIPVEVFSYLHSAWQGRTAGDIDSLIENFPEYAIYLHNVFEVKKAPPSEKTATAVRLSLSVNILKDLHENFFELNAETCISAALRNDVECLTYAHEHSCPWDKRTIEVAVMKGNMEALRYAIEHHCPVGSNCTMEAAVTDRLSLLQYLHESGTPWSPLTATGAASVGALDCLKYLHEHGCPWDDLVCSSAAENGHLECLAYARTHGCPCDAQSASSAARGGQVHCLKYLHETNCSWDEGTCTAAAASGSLECLVYAREHGCPWNVDTAKYALCGLHSDCLQYAVFNGCPCVSTVSILLTFCAMAVCSVLVCGLYGSGYNRPLPLLVSVTGLLSMRLFDAVYAEFSANLRYALPLRWKVRVEQYLARSQQVLTAITLLVVIFTVFYG